METMQRIFNVRAVIEYLFRWAILLIATCLPAFAFAQSFENTTTGALGDGNLCVGATNSGSGTVANFDRTFSVTGVPSVDNITVGLVASHSWRGDLRIQLLSPAGTTQTLVVEDTSNNGNLNNYNITFVDGVTPTVNEGDHANDTVGAPFYAKLVAPDNPLSVFNGQNGNGTWTLRICDDYGGSDSGQFERAQLTFTNASDGDVSLSASVDNAFPQFSGTVVASLTVTNTGPATQTGLTVAVNIPAGYTTNSVSGDGTLSGSVWTVPDLAANQSATIDINLTVGSTIDTITADLTTASEPDPDSTPGNGATTEDDYASVQIIPQPPTTPPTLSCQFNPEYSLTWDDSDPNFDWPAGSLSESFKAVTAGMPVTDPDAIDVAMSFAGDTGFLLPIGGQNAPVTQTGINGGLTGQTLLGIAVDFPSASNTVDITMTLGIPAEGVEGVQFTITDVDLGSWIDRITVTGTANGLPVADPTLTPNVTNFVSGPNSVTGRDSNAGPTSADGNMVVTFNHPVDTINFVYDNDPSVGPDPGGQVIALSNLKICRRNLPDISAVKTVEVYDPSNLGLFMTPGNEVLYKISVTNSDIAQAAADDLDVVDTLPDNLRFVSATTTGFTGGTFDSPITPNTDCDGGACIVRFIDASLPIDTTGEVIVRALIK
jgi:uncharacterized repeat protein (TIGR01451 family)